MIIINLTADDHDSGDDNDEIQVQDLEESGIIDTSHENMSSSSMTSTDLSKNITDKPMQPVIKYPPTKFASTNRLLQSRWYEQFLWVEYSIGFEAAFSLIVSHVYMPLASYYNNKKSINKSLNNYLITIII